MQFSVTAGQIVFVDIFWRIQIRLHVQRLQVDRGGGISLLQSFARSTLSYVIVFIYLYLILKTTSMLRAIIARTKLFFYWKGTYSPVLNLFVHLPFS